MEMTWISDNQPLGVPLGRPPGGRGAETEAALHSLQDR